MIDGGPEHADQLGGRPAAGDSPLDEADQGRQQPVVKSQISTEVRQRLWVTFLRAEAYGAQPVGTEGEDHPLLAFRELGGPAQPGMATVERRVVVQPGAPLDRGQRAHVDRAEIEDPHVRRAVEEPRHQLFLGHGSEHLEHSGLGQVVCPGPAAPGGLMPEGGVGAGLDDMAVGQRQAGSRRAHEAHLALPGHRREAVDTREHLGRPRITHRTFTRSHRTARQNGKQRGRGIDGHCGGGQQKTRMDLSDGQLHSLAIPQAGRPMLRTP
jgi:hypothetical protein